MVSYKTASNIDFIKKIALFLGVNFDESVDAKEGLFR
jgi:hypothetical protein